MSVLCWEGAIHGWRGIMLYLTILLYEPSPVIKRSRPQVWIKLPIAGSQLFCQLCPLLLTCLGVLYPILRRCFEFFDDYSPLIEEPLLSGLILHLVVLARFGFDELILPGIATTKFFDDVAFLNISFELLNGLGEVYFAGYDRIQPAFDDVPDTCTSCELPSLEQPYGYDILWKIQGDLWTRTTPRLSG